MKKLFVRQKTPSNRFITRHDSNEIKNVEMELFVYTWTEKEEKKNRNIIVHWSIRNCVECFDCCRHRNDNAINWPDCMKSNMQPYDKLSTWKQMCGDRKKNRNNNTTKTDLTHCLSFANHFEPHECHYRHSNTCTHCPVSICIYVVTKGRACVFNRSRLNLIERFNRSPNRYFRTVELEHENANHYHQFFIEFRLTRDNFHELTEKKARVLYNHCRIQSKQMKNPKKKRMLTSANRVYFPHKSNENYYLTLIFNLPNLNAEPSIYQ